MFQPLKFSYALLFFTLACYPALSAALPTDSQQTMHIIADSSTFNYKTGIDVYEGNVKIQQGTTRLIADRLVTQKNNKHKIQEAIAYGINKPAEYYTQPKENDPILHAKAKIIKFYPIKSSATLLTQVVVTQGDNSFHGSILIYDMKNQIVTAPASKTGPATIIIEPQKLS